MNPYINTSQVASSVPYDNTTDALNAFNSTDVQSTIDTMMSMQYFRLRDDFMIDNGVNLFGDISWGVSVNNTGAVGLNSTNVDSNHPGIGRFTTGNGAASAIAIITDPNFTGSIKVGGGQIVYEYLVFITGLSTVTNEYTFRIGMGDSANADFTNGIYFQYTRTTSVNWLIKTANASTRTTTTTSTAVAANAWTKLRAVINAAGTSIQFFINGVSVGTITTNIPTVGSQFIIHQVRSAGNPSPIDVDYFTAFQAFTTSR